GGLRAPRRSPAASVLLAGAVGGDLSAKPCFSPAAISLPAAHRLVLGSERLEITAAGGLAASLVGAGRRVGVLVVGFEHDELAALDPLLERALVEPGRGDLAGPHEPVARPERHAHVRSPVAVAVAAAGVGVDDDISGGQTGRAGDQRAVEVQTLDHVGEPQLHAGRLDGGDLLGVGHRTRVAGDDELAVAAAVRGVVALVDREPGGGTDHTVGAGGGAEGVTGS